MEDVKHAPQKEVLIWKDGYPEVKFDARYIIWYKKSWESNLLKDLKSNNIFGVTREIKLRFIEVINKRITNLNNGGFRPIIIFPPQKYGQEKSMAFIEPFLKGKYNLANITSPNYKKLHTASGATERDLIIEEAAKKWELNYVRSKANPYFIFVDDIFTGGTTSRKVFLKIKNDWFQNEEFFISDEVLHNFEGIFLCRTHKEGQEKWNSVCCRELSQQFNLE